MDIACFPPSIPPRGRQYVHIWREGDQFIAHAMPLDVMSSGPDPKSARKALEEAVHVFLLTAEEMGTLEEILQAL